MRRSVADTVCLECTMTAWGGDPHACRWCCDPLPPHRPRWCSRTCMEEWREQHVWAYARQAVRQRDGNRCTECLERRPIVHRHHRVACAGIRTASCAHHTANLQTLCPPCHARAHQEAP